MKETAAVYAELRLIEKDISDMCELMGQLRDMVERNGEMVDQIEAWVAQDLEHVKVRTRCLTVRLNLRALKARLRNLQGGLTELERANRYKRAR